MPDLRKLIIYGAGDLGREIMYAAMEQHPDWGMPWTIVAFVDDAVSLQGTRVEGVPVYSLESLNSKVDLKGCSIISGIGNAKIRKKTVEKAEVTIPGIQFGCVIHRSATIMPTTNFAEGTYVGCNTTIGIGSTLHKHSAVNFQCSIGHDVQIGEYSIVSPGCVVSGRVELGETCFLGSGVVLYPRIKIGVGSSVAAGLTLSRSIKENVNVIPKPNFMILPNQSSDSL
jgi:sugar O-acyltransferase (sialic acid O-acetyltransferase NeuD family)